MPLRDFRLCGTADVAEPSPSPPAQASTSACVDENKLASKSNVVTYSGALSDTQGQTGNKIVPENDLKSALERVEEQGISVTRRERPASTTCVR